MGTHQKIDRVAYQHLSVILAAAIEYFPDARAILHFEGVNGPDAIKRKSPAHDEPWHYYNPFNPDDTKLLAIIHEHHEQLVKALKKNDKIKAAFEAAWMSHAIVDGLTPAHHYPYEENLVLLRGGEGVESRTTIHKKLVMPGKTRRESLQNNWKMWGPKGLLTTHGAFEWGVAVLIKPLSLKQSQPVQTDLEQITELGIVQYFALIAKEIAAMDLYLKFYKAGWTAPLARQVREQLAPTLVKAVTLAWYDALRQARLGETVA